MKYFITALLLITILLQGGFHDVVWSFAGVAAFACAFITLRRLPRRSIVVLLAVTPVFYALPSFAAGAGVSGCLAALRSAVILALILVLYNVNCDLYESVFIAGMTAAAIGLLSYCGIAVVDGGVSAGRLQSFFQYANAAGLFLGVCAFLTRNCPKRARFAAFMETAMLLTRSVGAIATYIAIWAVWYFKNRDENWVRFACDFLISAASAALAHLFVSDGRIPAAALLLPVSAVIFNNKKDAFIEKISRSEAAPLAAVGSLAAAAGLAATRGLRPLATYAERVIQISDGLSLMLRKPLGIGAGEWGIHFTEFQTAPYSARLIHSGYAQIGVDAGIPALCAAAGIAAIWIACHNRGAESFAVVMILCHAAFDITFSFLAIDLMLCMLLVATLPRGPDQSPKPGNLRSAVRCALLVPLILCSLAAMARR